MSIFVKTGAIAIFHKFERVGPNISGISVFGHLRYVFWVLTESETMTAKKITLSMNLLFHAFSEKGQKIEDSRNLCSKLSNVVQNTFWNMPNFYL